MAIPRQFESPRLRTIDVLLVAGRDEAWLKKKVVALGGTGWRVRPVPFQPAGAEFDVVPRSHVGPARAWDFARQLRALDGVLDAEPSFEVHYAEPRQQDGIGTDPDITPSPRAFESFGGPGEAGNPYDWSVQLVQAEEAWALPGGVASRGRGIRIGHPDSGYKPHPELGASFNPALGWDFIEGNVPTENDGGDHGLGTASVISSADNRPVRSITGIAPEAEVIPLRVTKPHGVVPSPVLFETGADRLRDAVRYALSQQCHVLSISLGWLPNSGLHRAIRQAVSNNVIVIAAAGNYTGRIVVWPGAYPETLAMAACNAQREPWWGSARGSAVDATGPGQDVWVADASQYVRPSSGTSYAVATVAGIAALWLAHHGRDNLLARYQGGPTLSEVFRHVLRASCDAWNQDRDLWGAGIVNTLHCLQTPLPEFPAFAPEVSMAVSTTERFGAAFPAIPEPELHERLARVFGVRRAAVPAIVVEHGRELRFWVLTHPGLRRALAEVFVTPMESVVRMERSATVPRFSRGLREALDMARD